MCPGYAPLRQLPNHRTSSKPVPPAPPANPAPCPTLLAPMRTSVLRHADTTLTHAETLRPTHSHTPPHARPRPPPPTPPHQVDQLVQALVDDGQVGVELALAGHCSPGARGRVEGGPWGGSAWGQQGAGCVVRWQATNANKQASGQALWQASAAHPGTLRAGGSSRGCRKWSGAPPP